MQSDETRFINVLIVDDIEKHRQEFLGYIKPAADIRLVGEASNKSEAIERAYRLQPHVIIMDWDLGKGGHGLEAAQEILKQNPHIRIIMMTQFEDSDIIFQALLMGVRGYFLKWPAPYQIIDAIRTIYLDSNHAIFSPRVASRVIKLLTTPRPASLAGAFPELAPREREVLEHIAAGHSVQQVAQDMQVARATIHGYLSSIHSKLHITGRVELALELQKRMQRPPGQHDFSGRICPTCGRDLLL